MADTTIPREHPEHRADSFSNRDSYAHRAAVRAVEEGHRAFLKRDEAGLHFDVVSDTDLGGLTSTTAFGPGETITFLPDGWVRKHYRLTADGRKVAGEWIVHVFCDCKSGQNRDHLPVPCKHAALVGRRLVREGFAKEAPATGRLMLADHLVPAPRTTCTDCGQPLERPEEASVCGPCAFKCFQ